MLLFVFRLNVVNSMKPSFCLSVVIYVFSLNWWKLFRLLSNTLLENRFFFCSFRASVCSVFAGKARGTSVGKSLATKRRERLTCSQSWKIHFERIVSLAPHNAIAHRVTCSSVNCWGHAIASFPATASYNYGEGNIQLVAVLFATYHRKFTKPELKGTGLLFFFKIAHCSWAGRPALQIET